MKKKLILVLSMLALMICVLALSVSAHGFYDYIASGRIPESNLFNNYIYQYFIPCENDDDLSEFYCFTMLSWEGYNNDVVYAYMPKELELFYYRFTKDETITYYEFIAFLEEYVDTYGDDCCLDPWLNRELTEEYFNKLFSDVSELTYEQGKVDGVTEYKASDEYNRVLNAQYTNGIKAGEIIGYDDGYAEGFNDGQVKKDGAEKSALDISKIFPSLILVSLITISVLVYLAFKKKKAR